jgi:hypothetical protein
MRSACLGSSLGIMKNLVVRAFFIIRETIYEDGSCMSIKYFPQKLDNADI